MCDLPASVTIGKVAEKIIVSNDWRIGLFIRNLSNNTVSIGFDHPAELNKGITLFAKESYSMQSSDTSTADVYAIASGDGSVLAIQEFSSRRVE